MRQLAHYLCDIHGTGPLAVFDFDILRAILSAMYSHLNALNCSRRHNECTHISLFPFIALNHALTLTLDGSFTSAKSPLCSNDQGSNHLTNVDGFVVGYYTGVAAECNHDAVNRPCVYRNIRPPLNDIKFVIVVYSYSNDVCNCAHSRRNRYSLSLVN